MDGGQLASPDSPSHFVACALKLSTASRIGLPTGLVPVKVLISTG